MTIDTRSNQYGKVLGDWHIREKIGWGAKGTVVYRITKRDRDGIWEEVCALKAIPLIQEWGKLDALSPERREEYYRAVRKRKAIAREEVKAMEKVRGESNIVTYIDSDAVEWETENAFGCDFLIRMEYLHDLRQLLDSDKVFSEPEIIRIGTDICHAIGECHRVDILHRDIKPENIFISDSGKYKLGDFGIARIMDACPDAWASTGIGTPEYAAPEQGSGKYDRRVDIYSLGLVLYELANGNRLPFAQSKYLNGDEIQRRLSNEPLPPPSGVSQALGKVILKACAFDPADRYQSATEFLTALQAVSAAAGPETQDPDIHVTIPIPANEKLPKQIPVRFQDKTVRVEIPKGVRNGTVIRVPGGGRWDPASGRSGDLLVTVQLNPPIRRQAFPFDPDGRPGRNACFPDSGGCSCLHGPEAGAMDRSPRHRRGSSLLRTGANSPHRNPSPGNTAAQALCCYRRRTGPHRHPLQRRDRKGRGKQQIRAV